MLAEKRAKIRNEIQLVITLGRKSLTQSSLEQSKQLINNQIDWDYLLAAAVFHGVFPPFFKHLKKHFASHVPEKCFRMMTGHNEKIRILNLALVGTYLQYNAALQKNNIKSVTFKGPSIALALYDDLLMREFSDVDVLVAPSDAKAAQELLFDAGYKPVPERKPPLEREFFQSDLFREFECEHTFSKDTPIGMIDLHWHIQPRHVFPISFDEIWQHSIETQLERRNIRTLDINLHLILLSVHASRHFWKRLLWICDIAELLDHPNQSDVDWIVVRELSEKFSVTPMVVLALNLANAIFGCSIPEFAKSEFSETVRELFDEVLLSLGVLSQDDAGMRFLEWKFCTRLISNPSRKFHYVATEVFHPSVADYVRFKLPMPLYKSYYLLHPMWLAQDAISRRLFG